MRLEIVVDNYVRVLLSLLRSNNIFLSTQIKLTAQEEVALELRASQVEYITIVFFTFFLYNFSLLIYFLTSLLLIKIIGSSSGLEPWF